MTQNNTKHQRLIKREIVRNKHFVDERWSCDFIPELLNTQKESFQYFLERNGTHPSSLEKIFRGAFPMTDGNDRVKIEYTDYVLEDPQFSPQECKNRGATYASKLLLKLKITVKVTSTTGSPTTIPTHQMDMAAKEKTFVEVVKNESFFIGHLPIQTSTCTFIINGNERYVVSQLKRCAGPLLCKEYIDIDKLQSSNITKIIPNRGSWLEFYVDSKNIILVKIDRKKKLPFTTFLMCFPDKEGSLDTFYTKEKILKSFYFTSKIEYLSNNKTIKIQALPQLLSSKIFLSNFTDENGEVVFPAKGLIDKNHEFFSSGKEYLYTAVENITSFISLKDIYDEKTGEVYLESGDNFSSFFVEHLKKENSNSTYDILCVSDEKEDNFILNTVRHEKNNSRQEALLSWARLMKHSEYAGVVGLNNYFTNSYLSNKLYDMSSIGRRRCIQKFREGLLSSEEVEEYKTSTITHLIGLDIINMVQNLIAMYKKEASEDDPDSYSNRRIRAVGELLSIQISSGLERIAKKLQSKNILTDSVLLNGDFFNPKTILYPLHEFLNTSPLSQYASQENILSKLRHANKLSVFGPGGISGNTVATPMRDVNPTQLALVCPVETPEGQHIGLVTNLAIAAKIDMDGFLMAPFFVVKNCIVTNEKVWLNAFELSKKIMAAKSSFVLNEKGQLELKEKYLLCRNENTYKLFSSNEVNVTEVSPLQMFSISTAHLPNAQYGDGYRSAMAAAMNGQAVVLLHLQPPLIGTGMEKHSAIGSGEVILAEKDGIVRMVDSRIIVVENINENKIPSISLYEMKKFERSNQDTCINQRPIVRIGDKVQKGAILADGYSTYKGELALGRNLLVMYLANEYGFEDAMTLNKDLVDSEQCSSLHIYSFEIKAQDTRYGMEEITRDLPEIRGDEIAQLDENGIIHQGARVKPGDYLVGKITPEGEKKIDPQKKLLQAIFLNKADIHRKTPLVVPPSIPEGSIVTDVKIFTKSGIEMSGSALVNLQKQLDIHRNTFIHSKNILINFLKEKCYESSFGQKLTSNLGILKKGTEINALILESFLNAPLEHIKSFSVGNEEVNNKLKTLIKGVEEQVLLLETQYEKKLKELSTEHKFPDDTTLQMVRVYITSISKTEVGDKFASRYGNKGIISKIKHRIDMPYLEDGRIVDLVLDPLGILARMNLGQLYEILTNIFSDKMRQCVNEFLNQYLKYKNDFTFKELQKAIIDAAGTEKIGYFFINENENLSIYELSEEETVQLGHKLTEGIYSLVPPFESISLERIQELLAKHKLPIDGKVKAYDGMNSEPFEDFVLVGLQFFMQLIHKVQQKIHARSTGAYLKHTGQPTNGKQRGGGQKIGEMEHWAQAAHGAAFICKETSVKSDDAKARKEFFIRQCSNNPSSLLTSHIKKEINTLNRLDKPNREQEEDLVEPSFALVKEELFACGFKMIQRKIIHVEKNCLKESEEENIDMDVSEETEEDLIIDGEVSMDALEAKNLDAKIKLYQQDSLPQYEKIVSFSLASPQDILNSSNGEVLTTETLNYRTNNPEKNGLFCEVIFGPVNNYECACKKYTQKKYFRIKCDKCGVTVLHSSSRRYRRGHIELAYPMIHPFYLRPTNNKICLLLDISYKDLLAIKSLEKYIVISSGLSKLSYKQIISKEEAEKISLQALELALIIGTGAKALRTLLEHINFNKFKVELKEKISKSNSDFNKKHYRQVLSIVHKLQLNNIRPEWMILKEISVLPANLRDIVPIAPNEFASSDLNALYREVIGRNNRLKHLIDLEITDTVIENEIRMLQESVNALFGGTVSMKGHSKYKSLAEFLQGKNGRFRQNLLGKRVDYSARSVIVIAPNLKMNECYIPRDILLVLFRPYMYFLLKKHGIINTWKDAQKILEDSGTHNKIWDLLLEAIKFLPYCLLNRAPSLHRLSILGFKIIPWKEKAIGLHPLVCSVFNADFDGDQMAVHLPLSIEGQLEAEILMTANHNILSATNGQLVIGPRQDITIGLYTLTMLNEKIPSKSRLSIFNNVHEVQQALLFKVIHAREEIMFFEHSKLHQTTVGRVLLWEVIPKHESITFDMVNKPVTDKIANHLLNIVRKYLGDEATVDLAEDMKRLGFEYAAKFGISIGLDDFPKVENVKKLKEEADKKHIEYELQYMNGLITIQDKEKKIYQLWTHVIRCIRDALGEIAVHHKNVIFLSIDSGARGSYLQLMQIIGIKGFISHVDGSVSGFVIKGNYINGLTSQEAFDAQAAARTVGANSSLKTAISGYATRKLVDVAHATTINISDCNTLEGITVCYRLRNGQIQSTLAEQVVGRIIAEDMVNPITGEVVFKRNYFVTENDMNTINNLGIVKCKIRSPITCASHNGICIKCYGADLSTGEAVVLGEAVGIIAAQSIGEPGSQLTLKSKAFGGVAQHDITATSIVSAFSGIVKYAKIKTLEIDGKSVVFSRGGKVLVVNEVGNELIEYIIPYGATLLQKNAVKIKSGDLVAEWDLHQPILSEYNGICKYENILDKITCDVFFDDTVGQFYKIIKSDANTKNDLIPVLVIYSKDNSNEELARYVVEEHTIIQVEDGEEVFIGTKLGRVQTHVLEKIDIIGGLPKVSAFLENRQPKIPALLSPFSGFVEIKKDVRGRTKIQITNEKDKNEVVEYTATSKNHRFIVHTGEFVDKGDELTIGTPLLNDILHIKGIDEFFKYFLGGIKRIYEEQGIFIKNIHFEVIASRLLSKVMITESGDSEEYVVGEVTELHDVLESNETLENPIQYKRIFMGLTATALSTPSILSAMSFQGTTLVLADSIVRSNKVSKLGFKEELMLGELPSIGTGFVVQRLLNSMLYSMQQMNFNEETEAVSNLPISDEDAMAFVESEITAI
jgi:DNA-directed RNA polymerase beta' subunit/DNA-directed RNA polymerase beta subunit